MSDALADNVARFRKARNLSQEELAAAASVGVDTVGRIERGERRTTRPATVAKLARALGVTPDALLGMLVTPHGGSDNELARLRQALTARADVPGLDEFTDGDTVATPADLTRAGRRVTVREEVPIGPATPSRATCGPHSGGWDRLVTA